MSDRNAGYASGYVGVANGAKFVSLVMSHREMEASVGVLYLHRHKQTGVCYVGVTEQRAGLRWAAGGGYRGNRRFSAALKKHSWQAFETSILAFADTRADLHQAEIEAIAAAGGHKSRFTYNLSPGGDRVAENDRPIFGIHLPSQTARRFKSSSDAARCLGFTNADMIAAVVRGERHSAGEWWFYSVDDTDAKQPETWGENLRLARVRATFSTPLIGVNLKSGERREFDSASAAANSLGLFQTSISAVARKAQVSAGGWAFFLKGEPEVLPTLYGSALIRSKRDRAVYGLHLKTGEKRVFRNCTAADHELSLHAGAASSVALNQRASAGGWCFSYSSDVKAPPLTGSALVAAARSKPVVGVNLTSGQRRTFPSAKAASEELGMSRASIAHVLAGRSSSSRGWRFEWPAYMTDEVHPIE